MGAEGSRKKTAHGRTAKPLGLKIKKKKNKNKNKEHHENIDHSELVQNGENLYKAKEEKKKKKSSGQKRSKEKSSESKGVKFYQFADEASKPDNGKLEKEHRKLMMKKKENDKRNEAEVADIRNVVEDTYDEKNGADTSGEKKTRKLRKKKIKNEKLNKVAIAKGDELYNEVEDDSNAHDGRKLRKKKQKNEKLNKVEMSRVEELYYEVEDGSNAHNDARKTGASQFEGQGWIESAEPPKEAVSGTKTRKSKKAHKIKRKDRLSSEGVDFALEKGGQTEDGVYQISSGDEDCSRGMKKWITEHYRSRPGLKVLQQRIDDFITAHDAQEEQARKEREAQAADGGWTVVVHHKGRKKTTDSESGITVGSVAPEAVMEKMAKKKSKEVGLDFYRFQKREAQRNEIMMLQSKFEQDKKRIQQLRAARKFRPY